MGRGDERSQQAPGSVEAWGQLIDALAAAGRTVADIGRPGTDIDVAEGFRYVLNVLGDQLDRATLSDSGHPVFLPGITPVRKLFFDNPDTDYDTALITGDRTYRISGFRGTATYLAFCVYSGRGPGSGSAASADPSTGPGPGPGAGTASAGGAAAGIASDSDAGPASGLDSGSGARPAGVAAGPGPDIDTAAAADAGPGAGATGHGGTRVANLADTDMVFGPDGSFELTLSPTEPSGNGSNGGNWIRLDPEAHAVIARQYFLDRATERPARYRIEAEGDLRPDPPLDGARFAHLARRTARFVAGATELAHQRAEQARARPNRFVEVPGHGVYGTPDAGYVACWYELEPDQALVIEARPPRCRYWGVHLANLWGQSLDHRTRTTALNARTATAGPDGSVRIVVAHADPTEANWLDTAGHLRGWVLFRWLLADEVVVPDAHVVTGVATHHSRRADRQR